jgi:hypothetical protein
MRRFSSFTYAPSETRRLLRDRFARFLPSPRPLANRPPAVVTLLDEAMLSLFMRLRVDSASSLKNAKAFYEEKYSATDGEPIWDALISAGWLREVCGNFYTPFRVARVVSSEQMPALARLLANRHQQTFHLTESETEDANVASISDAIIKGELPLNNISCQSPSWVAARLWDRSLAGETDLSITLRTWVARWILLGAPTLVPMQAWNEADADRFCQTAVDFIRIDVESTGWESARERMVKELALVSQQPVNAVEGHVSSIPGTLVDRALSLDLHNLQTVVQDGLEARDETFGLFRLLLTDVEMQDHAGAPHKTAEQLFALAMKDPETLFLLLLKVRQNAALLADMILFPPMAPLACLLVAQWTSPGGAWDRELSIQDDATSKATAFADAVSVMGHFLEEGKLRPQEVAGLLRWLHANAAAGFIDDHAGSEPLLRILQDELANQKAATLCAILAQYLPNAGLGTPEFAAALDIIDFGKLAGSVDPTPVVEAYLLSIAAGDYTLSAHRIGVSAAASLYELARRSPAGITDRFLRPLELSSRLAIARQGSDNPFSVANALAHSLRAHIRILSRLIASCGDVVPDSLTDGLVEMVEAGIRTQVETQAQTEKVPIGAFSPRHEQTVYSGSLDRPIAADLGTALGKLADYNAKRLLTQILAADEPMLLAGLLSYAPYTMHSEITERLNELVPSNAGAVWSLPETHARIDAMLSAGALDAAERYIQEERDLKTQGAVPGREMRRLHYTLRSQFMGGDWASIEAAKVPDGLPQHEAAAANDEIEFYRGLSALRKPGGHAEYAEATFAQLQHKRPDIAAYAENLFAARVTILLAGNAFAELRGESVLRARQVLHQAEQMVAKARATGANDGEVFSCNKALLLLAMGSPARALGVLMPFRHGRLQDAAAAYMAVAQARLGHVAEGLSILQTAELSLGDRDVLKAAREHIENGKAYAVVAPALSTADLLRNTRLAFHDLSQMSPTQQASVLRRDLNPFETLVIDEVRAAAASVTSLVPMMTVVNFDGCEDDLNALIKHLLSARGAYLGWSWNDQSKGGFTAKGNPGERDLALDHKGTELTVIEALVCRSPMTHAAARDDLKFHFQKLFAYTDCPLLFLVAYADIENPASVLDHLRQLAAREPPPRFYYTNSEDLPHVDAKPPGFVARYKGESDDVRVAFLVLDIRKQRQRDAAEAAGRSNPRKRGTPKSRRTKRADRGAVSHPVSGDVKQ